MNYNEIYWIFIADALGFGSQKINDILKIYKNAKNFFNDRHNSWKYAGFLSRKNIESLKSTNLDKAYKIIDKCQKLNYEIISIENPKYPKKLMNINNPPAVLYIKGTLPDVNNKLCISIVGTRSSTLYGNKISFELGYKLAKSDVIVISGGAIGIDCSSQKGAIQAHGKTIAVLGCGFNHKYLVANKNLREAIAENGALISEYPPDYACSAWTFPMRNRIISGLSDGVLVVEAGEKSGSLITANLALEQNRDLFAVPGSINSSVSDGTNKLIQICAKPVMCAEDIINEYYNLYPYLFDTNSINNTEKNKFSLNSSSLLLNYNYKQNNNLKNINTKNLSDRAKKVLKNLNNEPLYTNEIAEKSKLSASEILQAITELELYNLIKTHPGKRYSLKY